MKKENKKSALRIKSIEVTNFKSLVNFKMDLAKFTCLVGMNGSGKSTVLQFIDFLSQLVRGNMREWLGERQWSIDELKSQLLSKPAIKFCIRFMNESGQSAGRWEGEYNVISNRCTKERIDMLDYMLQTKGTSAECYNLSTLPVKEGFKHWKTIDFKYEGSILSVIKEELLPKSILNFKHFFENTESLDMLTPDRLRQESQSANGALGHGGRNLAAFLFELGTNGREAVAKKLLLHYPQLAQIDAVELSTGEKQIHALETFQDKRIQTGARHLNDGMLRLIAVLSELSSKHCFVLFDEIENGINTELVEFVMDTLVAARQQVLVTTHSPLILNFLEDEVAKAGVMFIYKTASGHTQSIRFFDIPSMAEKLTVMGPGEVFSDTYLTRLPEEAEAMKRAAKKKGTKTEEGA